MFKKRFKVGDIVKLIRTGQRAEIIGQGSAPLARRDTTTFVLKVEDGRSVTVLPEEIERWRSK